MTSAHPPQTMLTAYASGALAPGLALAVAGHLSLCPACRDLAARMAALCGALMASCSAPVAPSARCLDGALARLDDAPDGPATAESLPDPLCRCLTTTEPLAWAPVAPGITCCRIEGFPSGQVGLVRAEPGTRVPLHGHAGPEATLVLEGSLRDDGRVYRRGDIRFCDETIEHSPEVAGAEPCVCLVVTTA